jgi:predicted AAA+ superfamily ATPase
MTVEMAKTIARKLRDPGTSFFLFGPRGTGKTTWLRQVFPDAVWIDLLDPENERRFSARPERLRELVAASPGPAVVVVDEVQRVPGILPVVHGLIEGRRDLRFVLTGSSARKLRRAGEDLLGGRAVQRSMHPFLACELGDAFRLDLALARGLVPIVCSSEAPAETLRSYAGLYVTQEVKAEGMVRDAGSFARFLESVSFSHGQVLNVSNLSRECAVSRKTAEGYLAILDDLLLAFTLPVFTRRAARGLRSHPKWYFFDAGLFCALRPSGPLDRPGEIAGAALEGLVAQHLRAYAAIRDRGETLSFWRTRAGSEVDFVLYGEDLFAAVEVKNARELRPRDLSGLVSFGEDYPEASRILAHRGEERTVERGVLCLPVEELLRALDPLAEVPGILRPRPA